MINGNNSILILCRNLEIDVQIKAVTISYSNIRQKIDRNRTYLFLKKTDTGYEIKIRNFQCFL